MFRSPKHRRWGRKFTMAYTALWVLTGLTVILFTILIDQGEVQRATHLAQVCIAAISGLLSIYFGGQTWIDRAQGKASEKRKPGRNAAPDPAPYLLEEQFRVLEEDEQPPVQGDTP